MRYDVAVGAPEHEEIQKHDTYRHWDWPELEVLPDGTSYFVASNNSPAGMLFWRRCSP